MTFEEFAAAVARVDVSGFPIPLTVRVEKDLLSHSYNLRACMQTKDRETGQPTVVHMVESFNPDVVSAYVRDGFGATEFVHDLFVRFLKHELDEWFLVDGKRAYDPHARFDHWVVRKAS